MPYIEVDRRQSILFDGSDPVTPGELNYLITEYCLGYLERKGTSYTNLNEIVGVLECAKQEFYRRAVSPYEDEKIKENGDIYSI